MGEFCFRQSVRKLIENYEKVLFYETFFEESKINWKPLIWSNYNIKRKFGQKIIGEFGFWQSVRKLLEN